MIEKLDYYANCGYYFICREDEWTVHCKSYCPDAVLDAMERYPNSFIEVRNDDAKIVDVIYPETYVDVDQTIKESYIVSSKAEDFGGSFERNLAKAIRFADTDNLMRIRKAFPEFWNKWLNW